MMTRCDIGLPGQILKPLLAPASVSAVVLMPCAGMGDSPKAATAMPRDNDPKRVLPESARARGRAMAADPDQARAFLQRAGIIDDSGQLTRNYR